MDSRYKLVGMTREIVGNDGVIGKGMPLLLTSMTNGLVRFGCDR